MSYSFHPTSNEDDAVTSSAFDWRWLLVAAGLLCTVAGGIMFCQTYTQLSSFGLQPAGIHDKIPLAFSSYTPLFYGMAIFIGIVGLVMPYVMPLPEEHTLAVVSSHLNRGRLGHPAPLAVAVGMLTLCYFALRPLVEQAIKGISALKNPLPVELMFHRGVFAGVGTAGLFLTVFGLWWLITRPND
jgi:hypothetical protein